MVPPQMLTLASTYTFGDALLTVLEIFLFVAWITLAFYVFADIFRSHDLSGGAKALWCLGVFIFPMLGCLIYLIVRGGGIHERALQTQRQNEEALRTYIRQVQLGEYPAPQHNYEKPLQPKPQGNSTSQAAPAPQGAAPG